METTCGFSRTRWMEEQGQKLPVQSGQRPGTGAQDRWVLTRRRVSALWQQRQKLLQAEEFATRERDSS